MEELTSQNKDGVEMIRERTELAEKIYELALEEHREFKEIAESNLKDLIETALMEIEKLEDVGNWQTASSALTPETAQKISVLWIVSGAGTYQGEIVNDRYRNYSWARDMDRVRILYGTDLVVNISEKTGAKNVPTILYNGTNQQNSVLRDAITKGDIGTIPPEKIIIMGKDLNDTVDQIKTFVLPEHLHQAGGEIGIIAHAPHLMRIAHVLNKYKPFTSDMTIRLFSIATPNEGKEEYAVMEVRGLLYYIFIGKNAQKTACPYIIHGK